MPKFTVILYGTDSDGDPDAYQVHLTTKVLLTREQIIKKAKDKAYRACGRWTDRFEGKGPWVFAGHLEEYSDAR